MSVRSGRCPWRAIAHASLVALLLAAAPMLAPHADAREPRGSETSPAASWSGLIEQAMARGAVDAGALAVQAEAQGRRTAASLMIAGPVEAHTAARHDTLGSDTGYREVEAGLSVQLWRNGERAALREEAEALSVLAGAQLDVARLHVAGDVRAAWWSLAAASADASVAVEQIVLARDLVASTTRLVEAGEQARLDLLQAQAALAEAEAVSSLALGRVAQARAQLAGLIGAIPAALPSEQPGALPVEQHPRVRAALAEASQRLRQARLARVQSGPGWRVGLDVRSERDARGAEMRTSTGVRVSRPLGRDPSASAVAAGLDAQANGARRQADAARLAVEAAQAEAAAALSAARATLVAAIARRAAAAEALALTERGWRQGELSFLELIRARTAAAEAGRGAAVARVAVDAAISSFNQAQGLLPQDTAR
jgi:cobalt-zinc-cadmium efflux system outer membrane protein